MAQSIDNSEDIIDSRDVIARVEELESDIESWEEDIEEHQTEIIDKEDEIEAIESESSELDDEKDADKIEELENEIDSLRSDIQSMEDNISSIRNDIEEAQDELTPIKSLADEADGYAADWNYGEALIRDSYFEEYAQQLAYDIGAVNEDAGWPGNHIDWEAAADELKIDYTCVDFDGVDYWIR